jgi:hypothetical protein
MSEMSDLHIQAFELGMPRKYSEHYLCNQVFELRGSICRGSGLTFHVFVQMQTLMNEEVLKDVTIHFGSVL